MIQQIMEESQEEEIELALKQAESYAKHVCYGMKESALKSCQISHPEFSDQQADILASALASAEKLRKLEIVKCPKLTGVGVARICDALRGSNVSHLSFEHVPIGDDGLQAIQNLLNQNENETLKFIGLEQIGPIASSVWDEFLWVATGKIRSLDLSHNSLTSDRVVKLASGIRNNINNLTALILSGNPIDDEGMECLSKALRCNRSIMVLAVGECQITDVGIAALNEALQTNCSLQRLYSYGNPGIDLSSMDNSSIRYWLALNAGRRAFLRSNECLPAFVPRILAKSSKRPELLYGLLQELPHVWAGSESLSQAPE